MASKRKAGTGKSDSSKRDKAKSALRSTLVPAKKKVAATKLPAPSRAAKASKPDKAAKPRKAALTKPTSQSAADERARKLALVIAEAGLEHKALNVEIIDVRGKVDYSDYVVVMSGRSDRQVNALGRNIEESVQQNHGSRCLGIEGMPQGTWLLMDYGDVVVHIFHEDTRGYYDLETLWLDAARIPVEDAHGG